MTMMAFFVDYIGANKDYMRTGGGSVEKNIEWKLTRRLAGGVSENEGPHFFGS